MIIDFIIEDLMLNSYLQKNFHTLEIFKNTKSPHITYHFHPISHANPTILKTVWH